MSEVICSCQRDKMAIKSRNLSQKAHTKMEDEAYDTVSSAVPSKVNKELSPEATPEDVPKDSHESDDEPEVVENKPAAASSSDDVKPHVPNKPAKKPASKNRYEVKTIDNDTVESICYEVFAAIADPDATCIPKDLSESLTAAYNSITIDRINAYFKSMKLSHPRCKNKFEYVKMVRTFVKMRSRDPARIDELLREAKHKREPVPFMETERKTRAKKGTKSAPLTAFGRQLKALGYTIEQFHDAMNKMVAGIDEKLRPLVIKRMRLDKDKSDSDSDTKPEQVEESESEDEAPRKPQKSTSESESENERIEKPKKNHFRRM